MASRKERESGRFPYESKNFIGDRLREIRLHFGFTQDDIARALNMSRSTYSYYELGTTRPDPATLARLAVYYDIPIEVFFTEDFPLGVMLHDSDGRWKRTSRSGGMSTEKIGDLRPEERSLILLLRSSKTVQTGELLRYVERKIAEENRAAREKREAEEGNDRPV